MSVGRGTAGAGRCADDLRFAQLYERYYRPIRDFFARRVSRDAVDDAVADTFLTVWRCLDEVPAGEAALVWLYGVAHRVVGHQRRSLARRGRLHERLRTVEFRPAACRRRRHGRRRRVSPHPRRAGPARRHRRRRPAPGDMGGAARRHAAAVLGIEPDTARQRLHRARRNLAREYDRLQSQPTFTPAAHTGGAR